MDRHKTYLTRTFCFLCNTIGSLALLIWLCAFAATRGEAIPGVSTSLFFSESTGIETAVPAVLSRSDTVLYQHIFHAQKEGDWATADADIQKLTNKILLGHVLAERYAHHYKGNTEELVDWLIKYSDHPQAADLYSIAIAKLPVSKSKIPTITRHPLLEGYGDSGTGLPDNSPYSNLWHAGLEAWRYGNKYEAARMFSIITKHHDDLSPWTVSAAAYWSYRSYNALGQSSLAQKYLHMAAEQPRSFYGILARKQLKQKLGLDMQPASLSDSDMLEMIGDQAIRRTIALAQVGMCELAENELRTLFMQSDSDEKVRLLALAHSLNLASVQISMAKRMSNDKALDYAKYPIPNWRPDGGFKIAPELIFALMRQESGFRPSAVSSGGALGLMQLMPKTALLMQKRMSNGSDVTGNASEPELNITLGQKYVRHLLDNELVDGNLFYMLAAYNAGPGRLQEWKSDIAYHDDPLLFVESIPIAQTRHYVMQVMTNYWIYCELADKPSRSIYSVLRGHWPSYDESSWPVADASLQPNG